ncbi:Putative inorganic phosphate cotransporter [Frankliniella fusca]|uniref:Inorganic phosphate cotransporter n=1 Tax=Frankliniella fusca TaxID=407009 RepID=A0AAE1LI67_9NEOP|nr:Putative inorganic phosphate cotransporter [Frankliniella fusca]
MDNSASSHVFVAPPRRRFGVRHLQAVLMGLVVFFAYSLRTNLSVAIVAMIAPGGNGTAAGEASGAARVFAWDESTRGALLGAFYWGYTVSMVPSGELAQRLGASRLLAAATVATSAASMLLPWSAEVGDWRAVFANRVVQGLAQAPVFPCVFTLLGLWAPPQQRVTFTTFVLAFQMLGPMVTSPLCGLMASVWGWPSIFYSFGLAGVATGGLLLLLGADRPSEHRWISAEELAFIESSLRAEQGPEGSAKVAYCAAAVLVAPVAPPTPWRSILTSVPVWMLWISLSVQDMAYFAFLANIPTYLDGVLNITVEENGWMTSITYLIGFIACHMFNALSNFVRDRGLLSLTNNRKFFNIVASAGISVCVVCMGYVSTQAATVTLISLSMSFQCATFVAVQANFLDVAPRYAGPLYSVGNMAASILGIVGPQAVGFVVTDTSNLSQWKTVFWGEAIILMVACVLYTCLASAEVQPWNDLELEQTKRRRPTATARAPATEKLLFPAHFSFPTATGFPREAEDVGAEKVTVDCQQHEPGPPGRPNKV